MKKTLPRPFRSFLRSFGIRSLLPRTLFARGVLIVILPMLLLQSVSISMFYYRHWENVSKHMAIALANDISFIVRETQKLISLQSVTVQLDPDEILPNLAVQFDIRANWQDRMALLAPQDDSPFPALESELRAMLPMPFVVTETELHDIRVQVQLGTGVLTLDASVKRVASPTTYIYVLWMVGTGVVFLLISLLFLRNQVRPIQELADAAEQFGRGQELPGFKPRGALEVRRAAQAFIVMSERIRRQVAKRTQMLAAISHDLRTPLTRMKLQLALLNDDKGTQELTADILEMESMIREYLDFVRGEGVEKPIESDITSLLEEVVRGFSRQGKSLTFSYPEEMPLMTFRPQALKRCIANLLENAFRYGTKVELRAKLKDAQLHIFVEDNGPGIPKEERETVFQAFHTLNSARHRTGKQIKEFSPKEDGSRESGIGLGLSIVKDIVLGHGGTITLGESSLGGLRVHIKLPV